MLKIPLKTEIESKNGIFVNTTFKQSSKKIIYFIINANYFIAVVFSCK